MPEIKPFEPVKTIIRQTTGNGTFQATPATQVPEVAQGATAPVVEEPKEKAIDSERFAALTKKERQIQKRDRELKEREGRIARWEEAEKLASTNKLEAMKRLGISYDELTNQHLTQMGAEEQTPEAIATRKAQEITRQEIEAFRKEHEQKQLELQEQQIQWGLQKAMSDAQSLTKDNAQFEYINAFDAHDMVVELIKDSHFNPESEKALSVQEAVEEVEKWFETKLEVTSKLSKFRSKYLPPDVGDEKQSVAPATENTQKPQTLTHRNTVAPPKPRTFSAEERRERAIRIASGQQVD